MKQKSRSKNASHNFADVEVIVAPPVEDSPELREYGAVLAERRKAAEEYIKKRTKEGWK